MRSSEYTVNDKHLLCTEAGTVEQRPTQMRGGELPVRRGIVIHYTSGPAPGCIDWLVKRRNTNQSSAHLVIRRDGTVVQLAPFNVVTWHAGQSAWKGRKQLNSCYLGIELENWGELNVHEGKAVTDSATPREIPWSDVLAAAHKNGGGMTHWHRFTPAQVATCTVVCQALAKRYNLTPGAGDDIVGHDDISPGRKTDPGPAFPMGDVRVACGFPAEITK